MEIPADMNLRHAPAWIDSYSASFPAMSRSFLTVLFFHMAICSVLAISTAFAGLRPDDPEEKLQVEAISDNEWISQLPHVIDVEPGWQECRNNSKQVGPLEYVIAIMTDKEEYVAALERQVPGSLEGFPVVVVVDRSKEWDIKAEQMRAAAKLVIDDPANKWILKIPHVTRMVPSFTTSADSSEPTGPAIQIAVDGCRSIEEVKKSVPKTIGGLPTLYGLVENNLVEMGCGSPRDDDGDD